MKNKIILITAMLMISCSSNENKMIVLGNVDGLKKGTLYLQAEKDSLVVNFCLLYTSPSPRDPSISRMPSSA